MKMNKKKVFKFQRNPMVISHPLKQLAAIENPVQAQVEKNTKINRQILLNKCRNNVHPDLSLPRKRKMSKQKLQIPKYLRFNNILIKLNKKFIRMMDSQQALIPVDSLFQNQTICKITGTLANKNRQSFSRNPNNPEQFNQQNIKNIYEQQKYQNNICTNLQNQSSNGSIDVMNYNNRKNNAHVQHYEKQQSRHHHIPFSQNLQHWMQYQKQHNSSNISLALNNNNNRVNSRIHVQRNRPRKQTQNINYQPHAPSISSNSIKEQQQYYDGYQSANQRHL